MKVLGQPIFFIIWRFSLLRGTNVLKCMQVVHWKNFIMRGFHYWEVSLLEVPLCFSHVCGLFLCDLLLNAEFIGCIWRINLWFGKF